MHPGSYLSCYSRFYAFSGSIHLVVCHICVFVVESKRGLWRDVLCSKRDAAEFVQDTKVLFRVKVNQEKRQRVFVGQVIVNTKGEVGQS